MDESLKKDVPYPEPDQYSIIPMPSLLFAKIKELQKRVRVAVQTEYR
jgi:hypothetical protein